MEKQLKHLLRCLQIEYTMLWIGVTLLILVHETEVLPQGTLVGDDRADYLMQVTGILLAVAMIPFSLRLFSLSLTRHVQQQSLPQAMKSYRRWSEVRLALLFSAALFNISAYYSTLNTTGLLCGAMVMVASLFCVPGRNRMRRELNLEN